jgi:uncharacterized coiled-coil DUF342 family protein
MTENRDAYVQKLKAKLDEWDAEIDKLSAKIDQADAQAKIEHEKRLEEFRARREEVKNKLAELQQAGGGAWEDLKQGLENSWEILKTSFTRAKSEFERGYKQGREE